jgi:pyruvate/2-oxoglutarate dehydrogenase complex dihydrolipoamide dehydrogenase (E3) component
VPWVCFAEPELAQLGPTTEGLRALGLAFTSHRFPYAQLDRALAEGHPEGWVQLNLDPKGRLRSATVVGAAAGELIHELALARAHGLRSADLSQLIHAYPTHALALRRAADAHQALRLASWGGKVLRAWVRARAPWS